MKTFLNYLGQLRIYSLVDLVVLLVATKASPYEFLGVILLHIGFLTYLESRHSHSYRKSVPKYLWIILAILGAVFYGHLIFVLLYIICSFLYTLKNKKYFAVFAPLMRGLQNFFLVGGIVGFHSMLPWIVLLAMLIRNFIGDMRDAVKDRGENMKTLPVLLGVKGNLKYIHLIAILLTTTLWWTYTSIPIYYLMTIFLIEIVSYDLTPR